MGNCWPSRFRARPACHRQRTPEFRTALAGTCINTSPVVVLRFEGDTRGALQRIQEDFRKALQPLKPDAPLPF
jgi:hypothetical protein